MRANEFINIVANIDNPPEFIKNIHGWYDYSLYCEMLESELMNKPLMEDLDSAKVHQLKLLDNLSIVPKVGDYVIPLFVIYAHDSTIFLQGKLSFTKVVKIDNNSYHFDNGQIYPNERLSQHMFTKLYMFDSDKNKEKFLNYLTLSFEHIKPNLQENFIYEN